MRFEQLLHETIDEMAGEMRGPSTGLAARSLAKGRRIRRTRRIAVAGGAVLALVAVVLPWTLLPRPDGTAPPPVPAASGPTTKAASSSPTKALPGGWVVLGAGDQVLERASGEYVTVRPLQTVPAPLGDRLLVWDGREAQSVQLTDVRGGNVVNVEDIGFVGLYSWSPTGDRLVGGITQKEPFQIGFGVVDARTGTVSKHWIDRDRYDCSQCTFTWTRDGKEVALTLADRSGGEAEERISGLQLFDAASGAPTRSLPVKAAPSGPFSWSPDGRYVIGGPNWQVIDTTTGQSRPFPRDAVWASDGELLATDNGKVLTLTPDGTVTATTTVPGQEVKILGPP